MRLTNRILALLAAASSAAAQSNFDPAHSVVSVETVGALNWLPGEQHGAAINQFYASGYIYGANIGWISFGATPADQVQYRNNSVTDFGVNVTPDGSLRGFAYGANTGWINFESQGNPRVDWSTGKLTGRIWSANLGWINLETTAQELRLDSLAEPADSDNDTIPDAWEIHHAFDLTTFTATSDSDSDGLSDAGEYLAGTNPLDPGESLELSVSSSNRSIALQWLTKAGHIYFVDQRPVLESGAAWTPASAQVIGTGAAATITFPTASAHTFYRIRAYPPLSAP